MTDFFEQIYINLSGKLLIEIKENYYFLFIKNKATLLVFVYSLKIKHKIFKKLSIFKKKYKNLINKKFKLIKANKDGKFDLKVIKKFCN